MERQQQAVHFADRLQTGKDVADDGFVRVTRHRAGRGRVGTKDRGEVEVVFFGPGDVSGQFVKGRRVLFDQRLAAVDLEVRQGGWFDGECVGFMGKTGDGDTHGLSSRGRMAGSRPWHVRREAGRLLHVWFGCV